MADIRNGRGGGIFYLKLILQLPFSALPLPIAIGTIPKSREEAEEIFFRFAPTLKGDGKRIFSHKGGETSFIL